MLLGKPYLNLGGSLSTIGIRFFQSIVFSISWLFLIIDSYQNAIRVNDCVIETPIRIKPENISILLFEADGWTIVFLDSSHDARISWLSVIWILMVA